MTSTRYRKLTFFVSLSRQAFSEGVGWLSIAYTPEDGKRQSASVAYVHPSESHHS